MCSLLIFVYLLDISIFSKFERKGLCANVLLFEVMDVCYLYS